MTLRPTRNVSLTPELEAFIAECMASGDYGNASEVVRCALKLLRDHDEPGGAVSWPVAGGECGELIRQRNWSRTSLGQIEKWSAPLRTTVSNIVNSPVPKVLMWGSDHVMIYNDGYREIAGGNHPRALGGTVPGIWPEIWDWNRAILERGFTGEVVSYRDQPMVLHRNGKPEHVVFDLFYTPVYEDDGRVGGVMCTVVENTQRAAAEHAMARSEAELRRVTDALPMLVSYLDQDHVYRFANAAYGEWFGVDVSDVIGKPMQEVVGAAIYESRRSSLERAFGGETFSVETTLPYPSGEMRRVEVRYVPRVDADGSVPGIHILGIDINDRAEREAAVSTSNRRFRTAMDAMHGVLWTNSPDGRMKGEQPGWAALTGQTQEEYGEYGWADAVHPDDREASVANWNAAVAAKSMFVFEHRVRRYDGAWRTFVIRALPILDQAGEITEWVGVHTDITHQRAAEATLREQSTLR